MQNHVLIILREFLSLKSHHSLRRFFPGPELGLKHSLIQKHGFAINDFCASFEQAIIDVLVGKTLKAIEKYQPKTVILGGGVAANKKLRETLIEEVKNVSPMSYVICPTSGYAMDNAAMIAIAGYYHATKNNFTPWPKLTANPNWEISDNITI